MYYITNLNNQLVAADSEFLSLLEAKNLKELTNKLALESIEFVDNGDNKVEIKKDDDNINIRQNSFSIETLFGNLTLYKVTVEESAETRHIDLGENLIDLNIGLKPESKEENPIKPKEEPQENTEEEELIALLEETSEKEESTVPQDETVISKAEEEELSDFIKIADEEKVQGEEIQETSKVQDIISLTEPHEEEAKKEKEASEEEVKATPENDFISLKPDEAKIDFDIENISIDTEQISKELGISKDDYSSFLNEFIDKAIEEEETIKNENSADSGKSLDTLHKLSQMLHIDILSNILDKAIAGENRAAYIEDFYLALSNLTTFKEETVESETEAAEKNYENKICDLYLDSEKPIHFDFQIQQASSELGLPEELIEEFIEDFIQQAIEEKQTFIDVCKKGDIDKLHKTAHKLKGAAANLRIVPLADTLEELQFCEDTSRFEPLLKKYWGQFLTLENFMETLTQTKGGK